MFARDGSASGVGGESLLPPALGIRIGLQDVTGISAAEIDSILRARAEGPFTSLEDFVRRTQVRRLILDRLVHAGAFDGLAPHGRRALRWRVEELARTDGEQFPGARARRGQRGWGPRWHSEAPPGAEPSTQRQLRSHVTAQRGSGANKPVSRPAGLGVLMLTEGLPPRGLREYDDTERVRAELEVLGLDVTRHLLDFYGDACHRLGTVPAARLGDHPHGARVTVAGVKIATQTPQVRSGKRIIFLTVEDPTGPVDVTIFPDVQHHCARPAFHGHVLGVRGQLRRTGPTGRGLSVIAERVWDLGDGVPADSPLPLSMPGGRGRFWHASGGSAG